MERPLGRRIRDLAGPRAAGVAVRITALYVLAGAGAKLIGGDPTDLPAVLQPIVDRGPDVVFGTIIAVELAAALVALCVPRIGWSLLATLLAAFLGVLGLGLARGEGRCGCFGAASVPAGVMLALDATALLAILLTRPWRHLRATPLRPWLAGTAAATAGLLVVLVAPLLGAARVTPPGDAGGAWRLPAVLPESIGLRPKDWVGRPLAEIDLARYVDTTGFPDDATLIIYYETCAHCAAHLRALAADPGDRRYVLIRIPTPPDNTVPIRVDAKPPGIQATLPAGVQWRIRTPWEILVRRRVVTGASRPE